MKSWERVRRGQLWFTDRTSFLEPTLLYTLSDQKNDRVRVLRLSGDYGSSDVFDAIFSNFEFWELLS